MLQGEQRTPGWDYWTCAASPCSEAVRNLLPNEATDSVLSFVHLTVSSIGCLGLVSDVGKWDGFETGLSSRCSTSSRLVSLWMSGQWPWGACLPSWRLQVGHLPGPPGTGRAGVGAALRLCTSSWTLVSLRTHLQVPAQGRNKHIKSSGTNQLL